MDSKPTDLTWGHMSPARNCLKLKVGGETALNLKLKLGGAHMTPHVKIGLRGLWSNVFLCVKCFCCVLLYFCIYTLEQAIFTG